MANEAIIKTVNDLIAKGRIQESMRDEYISLLESNLQHDLLRGADYTNKTKALAQERREAEQKLQQEYQKVQAERAKLEQWQNQVQGELSKLDALPEMTAKIAAYEQALRDYQIYDQVTVPTVPKNQQTQPTQTSPVQRMRQDESDYMTKQNAGQVLRDFAALQSKINNINYEHIKLYGEPLRDDLVTHFFDTGEDPEAHWRVKYGIDAKRQQLREQEAQAERAKIREEERQALMKEMAMDPSRVLGSPTPHQLQGGLTPLMDQYASSRALANNPVNGQQQTEFVPPEKKPDMAASRERVAAASRMFMEHFDIMGNPITDKGKQLSKVYSD